MTSNVFRLFSSTPGWKEAEAELKAACAEAATKISAIMERHRNVGAVESRPRMVATDYIGYILYAIAFNLPHKELTKYAQTARRAE